MRDLPRVLAISVALAGAGAALAMPASTAAQIASPPAAVATPVAGGVEISSPTPDAYVSGATMLRAQVDAGLDVQSVTFFVDGRQFCSVNAPPFECEWEAGSTISAHL